MGVGEGAKMKYDVFITVHTVKEQVQSALDEFVKGDGKEFFPNTVDRILAVKSKNVDLGMERDDYASRVSSIVMCANGFPCFVQVTFRPTLCYQYTFQTDGESVVREV